MTTNRSRYFLLELGSRRITEAICTAVCACLLCGVVAASPGQLDPTFGSGGRALIDMGVPWDVYGRSIVRQPNGKLIVAGDCQRTLCLARFDANGNRDLSFGVSGVVRAPVGVPSGFWYAAASVANSAIVVVGSCYNPNQRFNFCAVRILDNGSLDLSFGALGVASFAFGSFDSIPQSVAVLADGAILIAGSCSNGAFEFCLAKLSSNGALDTSFGIQGVTLKSVGGMTDWANSAAVLNDGRVVLAGYCLIEKHLFCLARFSSSGILDATFGINGLVTTAITTGFGSSDFANRIVVPPSGGLLVAGMCSSSACVVKYLENGTLDQSFGIGGVAIASTSGLNAKGFRVLLDEGGKLILTSECTIGFDLASCTSRFLPNGLADITYGSQGTSILPSLFGSDYLADSFILPMGKTLIVGGCGRVNASTNLCVMRLKGGPYNPQSCALNADANQTIDPATDALLLTRYLLGFRGDALTAGAFGQSPTRTGQALETYLASLNLDADGDDQALAMTDGLLILRAMLGLTGDALTQGATNASHPNVRNAQQILSWIESTHGVACLP